MSNLHNYQQEKVYPLELFLSLEYDFHNNGIKKESRIVHGIIREINNKEGDYGIQISSYYINQLPQLSFLSFKGNLLRIIKQDPHWKNYTYLICKKTGYKIPVLEDVSL
jgi:hypothetical protein